MNSDHAGCLRLYGLTRRCLLPAALGVATLLAPTGRAADTPPPKQPVAARPAEPATHTLFMGVDIAIEYEKSYHRVRDVSGSSFVLTVGGKPVFVPTRMNAMNLKIEQSLKLTSVSATLNNLKGERGYTARNDPRMQRMKSQLAVTATIGDDASLAMGKYIAAQNKFGVAISSEGVRGADISAAALDAAAAQAGREAFKANEMATAMQSSDMGSGGFYQDRARADMEKELFDAIDVSFEVSSPVPLPNAYAILVTQFHERNAPPGTVRNWIYATSLGAIDERPRRMNLQQGGFPQGFLLDSFQMHLYNRGEEVATNVSAKRVPLTRDDAFAYLMVEYLSKNKGASRPPAPALGVLPPDFHARISGGQLAQTLYVKISKAGKATQLFLDEGCTQPLQDAYIDAVVKDIRFKPALQKGQPADGILALKLGELRL